LNLFCSPVKKLFLPCIPFYNIYRFTCMKNLCFLAVIIFCSCQSPANTEITEKTTGNDTLSSKEVSVNKTDSIVKTNTISLPGIEVPVLCYHQIREWKGNESRLAKDVIVPPARFKAQMQILADSGYQTVLPDQLYDYLTKGASLPPKPVMITFDDGVVDQYTIGAPELKKHGFKGVFFIMTISLGRSIYMSREQVKSLAEDGHAVETHTWSHQNLKKYKPEDWDEQIVKSCNQLQEITGQQAKYLAYPFGVWTQEGIPELKKRNIKAAFQLSTKIDENNPLYTIRRMIVPGDWSPESMIRAMKKTFKTQTE